MFYKMNKLARIILIFYFIIKFIPVNAEDGYELWLRYVPVTEQAYLSEARNVSTQLLVLGKDPLLISAEKELKLGVKGLLQCELASVESIKKNGTIIIGTSENSLLSKIPSVQLRTKMLGEEGFLIR